MATSTPNRTFRDFELVPNSIADASANLIALNAALAEQAGLDPDKEGGTGPIYGLNETYYIDGVPGSAIVLNSNNHVICLPGCRIVRPNSFNSGSLGVVSGGTNAVNGKITNARWIGGEFIGEYDTVTGNYPTGHVFRIIGDDIWIEDVTISGFGAAEVVGQNTGGIAMALRGDRIRVINPRIINPHPTNSAGIRVFGGTGFRCLGGAVDSGGDAALQFSTGSLDGADNISITDGAFIDTRCTSKTGRLMLVGTGDTADTAIQNVRYERISGEVDGDGECIRVHNNSGKMQDRPGGAIREVDFLDIRVRRNSAGISRGVVVANDFDDSAKRVAAIRFRNMWIETPTDIAFSTLSKTDAVDGEEGPIQDVSWIGGGVIVTATVKPTALSLERLTGGRFAGLRLAGSIAGATVMLGDTTLGEAKLLCQKVVFEDVVVDGVGGGLKGVVFDKAFGCTWTRGAVKGASAAGAAFELTAKARRITIFGAETVNVAANQINPSATCTIRDGYGDRTRTAQQLGGALRTPFVDGTSEVNTKTSNAALFTAETPPPPLTKVNGGVSGTLLALTSFPGSTGVSAKDNAPGGNLRLNGDAPLSMDDALLLVRLEGSGWLEMSRADA